jgi:hypothetical protein
VKTRIISMLVPIQASTVFVRLLRSASACLVAASRCCFSSAGLFLKAALLAAQTRSTSSRACGGGAHLGRNEKNYKVNIRLVILLRRHPVPPCLRPSWHHRDPWQHHCHLWYPMKRRDCDMFSPGFQEFLY